MAVASAPRIVWICPSTDSSDQLGLRERGPGLQLVGDRRHAGAVALLRGGQALARGLQARLRRHLERLGVQVLVIGLLDLERDVLDRGVVRVIGREERALGLFDVRAAPAEVQKEPRQAGRGAVGRLQKDAPPAERRLLLAGDRFRRARASESTPTSWTPGPRPPTWPGTRRSGSAGCCAAPGRGPGRATASRRAGGTRPGSPAPAEVSARAAAPRDGGCQGRPGRGRTRLRPPSGRAERKSSPPRHEGGGDSRDGPTLLHALLPGDSPA